MPWLQQVPAAQDVCPFATDVLAGGAIGWGILVEVADDILKGTFLIWIDLCIFGRPALDEFLIYFRAVGVDSEFFVKNRIFRGARKLFCRRRNRFFGRRFRRR